jgi:glutathione peroxidase
MMLQQIVATCLTCFCALALLTQANAEEKANKESKTPAALNFKMKSLSGKEVSLADYQGKVILAVNVASECGLTKQYQQLQALHEKYADEGLVILGFPCNQFGGQEPGDAAEIQEFCTKNYGVEFPLFAKVEVNGEGACEFYKHLTSLEIQPKGAGKIAWNFEKFLLDRKGNPVARFTPDTSPDDASLIKLIESKLAEKE